MSESFTTEPKEHARKGHSPVRQRCIEFLQYLPQHGFEREIPLEDAKRIFKKRLGILDRKSIGAYFGMQPHRVLRRMTRIARYHSGAVSFKNLELGYDVPYSEGHLETLGLVTIEKRGKTWFMIINDLGLVPELGAKGSRHCDVVGGGSKDEISLSLHSDAGRLKAYSVGVEAASSTTSTNTHNTLEEREKLSLENREPQVTPDSTSDAKLPQKGLSMDSVRDRAKVSYVDCRVDSGLTGDR